MQFQTDFSIEELAGRRRHLASSLPEGASALIPGAGQPSGASVFRQFNDFYYLCGVESPHGYLLLKHSGETTLFLPEGSQLEGETIGLETVNSLSWLTRLLQKERLLYLPSREGEGERESWGQP